MNVLSEWVTVRSGIPQGSTLGPILFLIYINDLPDYCNESSTNCNMFLYADDAKLCRHITSQEDNLSLQRAIDRFNKCLANAKRLCDCRVLCLHLKSSLCSCAHSILDTTSFSCRDQGRDSVCPVKALNIL